jgi:hypothetical protein
VEQLIERINNPGIKGLTTGFEYLDLVTGAIIQTCGL